VEAAPPRRDPAWKDLGFQGDDPVTDLRGVGMLSVRLLSFFARRYPAEFQSVSARSMCDFATGGYPLACAGVNVAYMLIDALQLRRSSESVTASTASPKAHKARLTLCKMMKEDAAALALLFCAAFCLLDKEWTARKATYLEFPAIVKVVREKVEAALHSHSVKRVDDVRRILLL